MDKSTRSQPFLIGENMRQLPKIQRLSVEPSANNFYVAVTKIASFVAGLARLKRAMQQPRRVTDWPSDIAAEIMHIWIAYPAS